MADSVTQILSSGPPGLKINIAVLGDGLLKRTRPSTIRKYRSF